MGCRMFHLLFGWGKASKCKKVLKVAQCRLKLLKNKRAVIVRHLHHDVASLLQFGLHHIAFHRVEQLIRDETRLEIYDLLHQYCKFLLVNLSYIRKHKDCPHDVNEAVSTLIFSSARFGELPELRSIRGLFGERYGKRFVRTAVELLPGNVVNHQVVEMVCEKMVSKDVIKYRMMDEIDRIWRGQLLLGYDPELQQAESSLHPCKEMTYLGDVQEFAASPTEKNGHLEDQSFFVFVTTLTAEKCEKSKILKGVRMNSRLAQQETVMSIESAPYDGEIDPQGEEWTGRILAREAGGKYEITVPKEDCTSNSIVRDNEYELCHHVHPRLPDYDDLAAKFAELKRVNKPQNFVLN